MRHLRTAFGVIVAGGVVGATLLLTAAPASASLTGACEASGELDGKTYNPKAIDEATIPREGDVAWQGSVPGSGDDERNISGEVEIEFPPPIGKQQIDDWDGPSSRYENSDTYHYELPSVLAGVEIPVTGSHSEPGVTCAGTVVVKVDGSPATNPAAIGSIVLTVITGGLLIVAMKPKVA